MRDFMTPLLTALVVGATLIAAPPAQAATAPFPYSLSIQGGYGSAEVLVPVPSGATPTRLSGRITSSYSTPGDIVITLNGRTAARVPAIDGGRFSIDVRADDIVDQTVPVGLRAALEPDQDCLRDDQAVASLQDPVLRLDEAAPAPRTIADFLSPGAAAFTVVVPADPATAEQAAGLDAMLALRHVFPPTTQVRLTTTNPAVGTSAQRVVVVTQTDDPANALTVSDGQLRLTGPAETLSSAAIALADPNTRLLNLETVTDVAGEPDHSPMTGESDLLAAGIESLTVSGVGTVSQTVTIPQALYGRPISQLIVSLRGAATPVLPGQQGRVNLRWNDDLVASQALTDDSRVSMDVTIETAELRATNYLTLELQYQPAGGDCSNPPLPGIVDIDVRASTLSPTFGTSQAPGFQRFPQSFAASIPVSLGQPVPASLVNAGNVLAAATEPSPLQYTVDLVDIATVGDRGGVATGVDPQDAEPLGAPLPDEQDGSDFPAGEGTPYAALQAFQSGASNVITLTAQPDAQSAELAVWPLVEQSGWTGLTGQAYVLAATSDAPEPVATRDTTPDKQTPQLIAAGVITALLLLVLILWLRRRPKRA
jgi:hypothetical protein